MRRRSNRLMGFGALRAPKTGPVDATLANGEKLSLFYMPESRMWVLQLLDANNDQIGPGYDGTAEYIYSRAEAGEEFDKLARERGGIKKRGLDGLAALKQKLAGAVEDYGIELRFEEGDWEQSGTHWVNAYLPSGDRIGKLLYGPCRGEARNAGKWRSPILDVVIAPKYRGMGLYPAMLSVLRDEVRQDKRCAGLFSDGDSREPAATASWEKFAEREPRVSRRGGNYYLDGLAANGEPGSPDPKPKKQKKKAQRCANCGTIVRNADYLDMEEALCRKCEKLDEDADFDGLKGLAANGQRGGSALPLATIALVGIGAFVLWKLLSSGETETEAREAVGSGPCRDIDSQLATPIGCGTAAVTGYVGGKGSPITIREIPGAPGYYLQSSPVDVWSAFQRLKTAAVNAGNAVTVNSAFRTMAKQSALYADYMAGRGNKAARPGYSKHQNGTAIDLAVKQGDLLSWLRSNASAYGFFETVLGENWHWEYDPARDRYARIA